MFKLTEENQIKYSKDLDYTWDSKASLLAKLTREKLEEECTYSGEGKHVYRFEMEGTLYCDKVEEGSFSRRMDILADDDSSAEEIINRYFLISSKNVIDYYKSKCEADDLYTCSFKINRLYTLEEAREDNEEQAMLDEFVDSYLNL